jgi:hypothetical protein
MGQWISLTTQRSDEEDFMSLIVSRKACYIPDDAIIGENIVYRNAKSEGSVDLAGYEKGIFAKRDLLSGEVILCESHINAKGFNDPMFDMRPFVEAKSATEMENAFIKARAEYYNKSKGEEIANALLNICPATGVVCIRARRNIAKDEQIQRAYGFSTWIKEIAELNILTRETLPGFLNFVVNIASKWEEDPFAEYFRHINSFLSAILIECYGANIPIAPKGVPIASSLEFDRLWKGKGFSNLSDSVEFRIFAPFRGAPHILDLRIKALESK